MSVSLYTSSGSVLLLRSRDSIQPGICRSGSATRTHRWRVAEDCHPFAHHPGSQRKPSPGSTVLSLAEQKVNVLPDSGTADPGSALAIPPSSGGLCGQVTFPSTAAQSSLQMLTFCRAVAENYPISYPYIFHQPGWYMFVLNQTWLQPTIVSPSISSLLLRKANAPDQFGVRPPHRIPTILLRNPPCLPLSSTHGRLDAPTPNISLHALGRSDHLAPWSNTA